MGWLAFRTRELEHTFPVRVLLLSNDGGIPGGHVVQARNTATALRNLGVDVTFTRDANHPFAAYDVVHGFGSPAATLRRARTAGATVVTTPIWWSADYTLGDASVRSPFGRLNMAARLGVSVVRHGVFETSRRLSRPLWEAAQAFEVADLLLPNSELEAKQIQRDLGVSTPTHVVPNAVDEQLFNPTASSGKRSGALMVGRLEPHKNQLGLIHELRGTGVKLTIVGPDHPDHPIYAKKCRDNAGADVRFLGVIDELALRDAYESAAVHVMPSWFETTGLSSLEAAAMGCAVVTTSRGFASEYFGDLATYCDPATRGSIRAAALTALRADAPPALRQRVIENFTWRHTARATLRGYEIALGR